VTTFRALFFAAALTSGRINRALVTLIPGAAARRLVLTSGRPVVPVWTTA
jgi:hypothetical protein